MKESRARAHEVCSLPLSVIKYKWRFIFNDG